MTSFDRTIVQFQLLVMIQPIVFSQTLHSVVTTDISCQTTKTILTSTGSIHIWQERRMQGPITAMMRRYWQQDLSISEYYFDLLNLVERQIAEMGPIADTVVYIATCFTLFSSYRSIFDCHAIVRQSEEYQRRRRQDMEQRQTLMKDISRRSRFVPEKKRPSRIDPSTGRIPRESQRVERSRSRSRSHPQEKIV